MIHLYNSVKKKKVGDNMSDLIDFHEYIIDKTFNEQVIHFFNDLNISFEYFRNDDEAIIVIKPDSFLITHLTFIPKNATTHLPTLPESLTNTTPSIKKSDALWVVNSVNTIHKKSKFLLYKKLKENENNEFIYLKGLIKK